MARIAFSIIFANRTVCHLRHKRKSTGNSIPPIVMFVEVTPRLRAMAPKRGLDWSTQALQALKGHKVKIKGWMLFDFEHIG